MPMPSCIDDFDKILEEIESRLGNKLTKQEFNNFWGQFKRMPEYEDFKYAQFYAERRQILKNTEFFVDGDY